MAEDLSFLIKNPLNISKFLNRYLGNLPYLLILVFNTKENYNYEILIVKY